MEQPADQSKEQAAELTHGFAWPLRVAIVLTTYLLAIGPAVRLHRSAPQARPIIEIVYFWVDPLARAFPPVDAALDWYVHKVWRCP